MEGAKMIRNIVLVGAFWTGVFALVTEANAESVYESETTKSVSLSPGMNPGTVPQAEIKVDAGGTSADSGVANTGGVQVQNVTVQAQAAAEAESKNANSNAADAINKARSDAELSNNALLLQQIELDRLKAEQGRIKAINEFGSNLDKPEHQPAPAPCGVGPCVTPTAPIIENNNTVINDSPIIKNSSIEIEEEKDSGDSFFHKPSKWGVSPLLGMRFYDTDMLANVENNYIVGIGVSADVNKYITAEFSYLYGEDKLSGFSDFSCHACWNESTRDTHEFTLGAKIGPQMNGWKPYLGLGLGYLVQNYAYYNGDRSTSNITGNIGGGVDFQVAKNFAVGARADYQTVLGNVSSDRVDGIYTFDQVYGDESDRYRLGATATVTF
jgi:hypothetical protein